MHITTQSKLLINNTSSYYTYQLVLREHTYYDSYSTTIDTYYILLLQYQRVHTTTSQSMHYQLHIHRVWILREQLSALVVCTLSILYAQMLCAYTLQVLQYTIEYSSQYSSTLGVASSQSSMHTMHTTYSYQTSSTLCIQYSFTTSSYA